MKYTRTVTIPLIFTIKANSKKALSRAMSDIQKELHNSDVLDDCDSFGSEGLISFKGIKRNDWWVDDKDNNPTDDKDNNPTEDVNFDLNNNPNEFQC